MKSRPRLVYHFLNVVNGIVIAKRLDFLPFATLEILYQIGVDIDKDLRAQKAIVGVETVLANVGVDFLQ